MNGSKGNAAFNASEMPERRDVVLSLNTASRMLPLVQRVVDDIVVSHNVLDRLQPEQDRLDRHKRDLCWLERQRRYQVHEEVATAERKLGEAREELGSLGVALLEPAIGKIGFPTVVNDRKAYFCWTPGEKQLNNWHFVEETSPRPIPASWWKASEPSLSASN